MPCSINGEADTSVHYQVFKVSASPPLSPMSTDYCQVSDLSVSLSVSTGHCQVSEVSAATLNT